MSLCYFFHYAIYALVKYLKILRMAKIENQNLFDNFLKEMSKTYSIAELKQCDIDECSHIFAKTFKENNEIWKSYQPSYEELFLFMREKIVSALKGQEEAQKYIKKGIYLNFIFKKKDKIIGVCTHYELHYFWNMPHENQSVSLPFFEVLEKAGKSMQKNIEIDNFEKGKYLYGIFGSILPEYMGIGVTEIMFILVGNYCLENNMKGLVGRSSNIKSFKLLMKLGGEMLDKIKVNDQGRIFTLSLCKVDFQNPIADDEQKIVQMVEQKIQSGTKIKPKL